MPNTPSAADFYRTCVCLGLNRAARVTARRYDAALKPMGITSGQFSILSSLLRDEPATIGGLADLLGMERTTLKRNLAPLETLGLVDAQQDDQDRRIRRVAITQRGRDLIDQALSSWREAQEESNRRLGESAWDDMRSALGALI